MDLPSSDYDGRSYNRQQSSEHQLDQQHMKPKDIRRNIPLEVKEISRDIQMRSKQYVLVKPYFIFTQLKPSLQ